MKSLYLHTQESKVRDISMIHRLYRINFFITLSILFLLFTGIGNAWGISSQKQTHKILVIHSYAPDYVAYPDLNRMIADGFSKQGIQADIHTFYLNCEQYEAAAETQRMYNYMDSLSSWEPDLILVNEDQATFSLLDCGHPLVQTTPIVFTGVNFPNWELLKSYKEITGLWDKPDYLETINMVEKLFGKTRIRFFHDNTFLGRQVTREIADQLKRDYPKISYFLYNYLKDPTSYTEHPNIDLFHEDNEPDLNRPDSTSFYFINLRKKDRNGLLWTISGMVKYSAFIQTKYDYTTMRIGRMAAIPIFTVISEGFDYHQGILGGYITTVDIQAYESTALASRILKGEKASQIPIAQSSKKHIVDWNELKRWNISEKSLPNDYVVINIPFHIRYKIEIITLSIFLCLFIIALIVYLSYLYSREAKRKREAQANLKRERDFLSLALEGSNIFAWKYNEQKSLLTFDKEFFDKLGIPPRSYTLQEIEAISHPGDYIKALKNFRQIRQDKQNRASMHLRCNFTGEGYIWYEFRYIDIISAGSIIGLILNIEDYKKREAELTESRDLAAKAELKQSFLANMSHEIRTPLNAIVGFSNLLAGENEQPQEERREFIKIINRNCELLLKLIDDILEISRIESNSLSFTSQEINLNQLIDDIYITYQLMMPKGVELSKDTPETPVRITTDKIRLNQVISNLLNNAIKFTTSGYIQLGYKVDESQKLLYIYVQDSGKGIPAKEQKMIFERFYKQDEFIQGTGLGLSICQGIIQKLGGEIRLKSQEGEGSLFTIVLPLTFEFIEETPSTSTSPTPEDSSSPADRQKTILIAEDNESNYMLLKIILQKHYELVWVKNGKDAVGAIEQQYIDLILMDIKMPEMDGLEALKIIRKKYRDLPIVMQTAYAFETDREEAEQAGCSGFITKPVSAPQLLKIVRNLIGE